MRNKNLFMSRKKMAGTMPTGKHRPKIFRPCHAIRQEKMRLNLLNMANIAAGEERRTAQVKTDYLGRDISSFAIDSATGGRIDENGNIYL
jgi:hypothetical protein